MLQLRPNCEHCRCTLAADSQNAMICSYECTFCRECVETILFNVCPNCGGGFCSRPIRPKKTYCAGTGLKHHPATREITFKPVDQKQHSIFSQTLRTKADHLR